ncbi:hypothetical protein ALC62_02244 [Cyphomyrmex costatus]|uniref:Uncharacterized protein n=1 Tax=Cyphomyrmex costatus TaxID=456900 RepID=A0A151INJ2_9HYME|nr:hypothetical protein ALC62_02244 [Cyphomyrmex costatus]
MREKRKDERERKEKEWARESLERRGYLWRCGRSEEALNGEEEDKWQIARMRDKEVDEQERGEKVRNTRSCREYQKVEGIPCYVRENRKKTDGKRIQTIARWRYGNENEGKLVLVKRTGEKMQIMRKGRRRYETFKRV